MGNNNISVNSETLNGESSLSSLSMSFEELSPEASSTAQGLSEPDLATSTSTLDDTKKSEKVGTESDGLETSSESSQSDDSRGRGSSTGGDLLMIMGDDSFVLVVDKRKGTPTPLKTVTNIDTACGVLSDFINDSGRYGKIDDKENKVEKLSKELPIRQVDVFVEQEVGNRIKVGIQNVSSDSSEFDNAVANEASFQRIKEVDTKGVEKLEDARPGTEENEDNQCKKCTKLDLYIPESMQAVAEDDEKCDSENERNKASEMKISNTKTQIVDQTDQYQRTELFVEGCALSDSPGREKTVESSDKACLKSSIGYREVSEVHSKAESNATDDLEVGLPYPSLDMSKKKFDDVVQSTTDKASKLYEKRYLANKHKVVREMLDTTFDAACFEDDEAIHATVLAAATSGLWLLRNGDSKSQTVSQSTSVTTNPENISQSTSVARKSEDISQSTFVTTKSKNISQEASVARIPEDISPTSNTTKPEDISQLTYVAPAPRNISKSSVDTYLPAVSHSSSSVLTNSQVVSQPESGAPVSNDIWDRSFVYIGNSDRVQNESAPLVNEELFTKGKLVTEIFIQCLSEGKSHEEANLVIKEKLKNKTLSRNDCHLKDPIFPDWLDAQSVDLLPIFSPVIQDEQRNDLRKFLKSLENVAPVVQKEEDESERKRRVLKSVLAKLPEFAHKLEHDFEVYVRWMEICLKIEGGFCDEDIDCILQRALSDVCPQCIPKLAAWQQRSLDKTLPLKSSTAFSEAASTSEGTKSKRTKRLQDCFVCHYSMKPNYFTKRSPYCPEFCSVCRNCLLQNVRMNVRKYLQHGDILTIKCLSCYQPDETILSEETDASRKKKQEFKTWALKEILSQLAYNEVETRRTVSDYLGAL